MFSVFNVAPIKGKTISSIEEQPLNAPEPIEFTELGITTLVIRDRLQKAE